MSKINERVDPAWMNVMYELPQCRRVLQAPAVGHWPLRTARHGNMSAIEHTVCNLHSVFTLLTQINEVDLMG